MKRGAPDHPKTLMLAAKLAEIYSKHHAKKRMGSPRALAIGILEVLWEWSSKYAIQGDIGKWPDEVIAQAIEWEFSPKELISSLIESRWLDIAPEPFRLVIHDIKDHATNTWRQNLEDAGLTWWDGSSPRKYKLQKNSRKTPEEVHSLNQSHKPEAEPQPQAEHERAKTVCISDGFSEFRQIAEEYGISGSEPDWKEAEMFPWKRLDFEGRLAAVRGIADRIRANASDDPARKSLPKNYLERRMWERDIRGSPAASRSEATKTELEKVLRREAGKLNAIGAIQS